MASGERRVKVSLEANVSEYTAGLARAAEETRGLGEESRKTREETKKNSDESTKASTALRKLSDAAGAAQLAQLRLNEAREKGKASGASMLSLTQRLEKAQRDLSAAQSDAVKVTGDNDRVQRTLAESLARAARSAVVQSELEKSGEDEGSTLSRGIRQGLTRNSPLIAAAIGGVMAAGAPVAIAGATALFGGIAAVAVHANQQVASAAVDLANNSMATFKDAAAQTIPFFVQSLQRLDAMLQNLRPQLDAVFGSLADPIDLLTTGIGDLVRNMMPGLVAAAQAATPVFQGLAALLGSIGTGVSGFMSAVAEHGPAAGQVFASLGQIIQNLLPALGEIVGAGAELAADVLPPLASVLGVVNTVLHAIEPVLPAVLAAFVGFKVVQTLNGPLGGLAEKLGKVNEETGKATGILGGLQRALPAIGAAAAAVGFGFEQQSQQIDAWATALNEGGAAAEQAKQQMQDLQDAATILSTGIQGTIGDLAGYGTALNVASGSADKATQTAKDQLAAMTPLQRAHQDATKAQGEYADAVDRWGASSGQAIAASYVYRDAQAEVAHQEALTKGAVDGVTQAMLDQYDQSLALTDSSFAYRDSQNQVADAQNNLKDVQSHLNDTNAATRTSTDDVSRAGLQLEEALLRQAKAAGQLASDALPATASELDHNTASSQGTLQELYKLRDQMGSAFPASLQQTIKNLEQSGVHLDTTAGQAQNLGDAVAGIPTMHSIHVDADLGAAQAKMDSFINKHWTAIISTNVAGSGTTGGGGTTKRLAAGGPVIGPGTATSDSVPIMGSDGEHMWTAREVQAAGGHDAMFRLRKAVLAGQVRRLAGGGPVSKDWMTVAVDADLSGASAGMSAAQRAAGASFSSAAGAPSNPTGNVALGQQLAAARGWTGAQWNALYQLWQHESGWRNTAQNPTSTAYGIAQFLNSTWASTGYSKTSDPRIQILAGENYIAGAYGTPANAWAKWQSRSPHWYANGGVIGEPVAGMGLRSGDRYMFGERGPEMVTPVGLSGRSSYGGASAPVSVSLVGAKLSGSLMVNGLESRMEAVVVDALTTAVQRGDYNG